MEILAVAGSHLGRLPGLNSPQPRCMPASSSRPSSRSQGVASCVPPLSCYHPILSNSASQLYTSERSRSPCGARVARRVAGQVQGKISSNVTSIETEVNGHVMGVEGQVTEFREQPEQEVLTRRSLLALPMAAAATLLVSPSMAAVTVENRAPSGNFLQRTFGMGDPDIYYPRFFQGTWNCYSTLIAVETPQGEDKVDEKSVEQSRKRLGYTTTYQARFVPFEGYVVCDRLFTTVSLVESIIGKNTVEHGTWNPQQPNRVELVLRGGAKVENTVTKRSAGMFSPYEFESAEFSRQLLDNFSVNEGPPTVKASQNLTRYQWDITADEVSKIEAIQKVSMYAVPKEGKDLEIFNSTQPITIYKYRVTFERQGLQRDD